jgi:hypothetical protein
VLCSFILSSPLFCFLTFIKSRPFSNYQVTVFIKIWIINFEILNMKCLNLASIQFFQRKITQPPVHSHRSTSSPVHQSPLYYYTIILLHHYTITPVHHSLLNHYTTTPLYDYTTRDSPLTTHY